MVFMLQRVDQGLGRMTEGACIEEEGDTSREETLASRKNRQI